MKPGNVYWITGLSGSGKSTLARALVAALRADGEPVVLLDGDDVRAAIGSVEIHSRDDRLELGRTYGRLSRLIAGQGTSVVMATISMFAEVFDWNRAHLPGYREVFLDVPLSELRRRDPKGIYARAARGEARDVAGVDFPVEPPVRPDVHVRWAPGLSADDALAQVWDALARGALPSTSAGAAGSTHTLSLS